MWKKLKFIFINKYLPVTNMQFLSHEEKYMYEISVRMLSFKNKSTLF